MYRDIAVMACSLAGELGHDTMEKLYRDMAGDGCAVRLLGERVKIHSVVS